MPRSSGSDVPAPQIETSDRASSRGDALWLLSQQVHEITGDLGKLIAKADRLISDVSDISKEVKELGTSFTLAKGFGLCAVVLVPACAALVWWLVGATLNDVRDQLLQTRQPPISAAPMSPGK